MFFAKVWHVLTERCPPKYPRILVFRGGALGDFMLTLPAIAALRRRWPKAYIEVVGHRESAGLARTAGIVDRVQSLDSARMALYFQANARLPPDEIKYIRSFDLIISYLHDPDGVLCRHLKEGGAKQLVTVSPIVKTGHAADHFLKAIENVVGDKFAKQAAAGPRTHFIKCVRGSDGAGEWLLLEWPPCLKAEARRWLAAEIGPRRIIVIHPGSGSPAKNWPAEKFAALARKIRAESDCEPLIIGGEADEKAIALMRSLLPGFHFLVNVALADVASVISVSAGYVGNDSGITHLAAALSIPVAALFGPTDPARWAPRGDNVSIIRSKAPSRESLAEIGIDSVYRLVACFFKKINSGNIPQMF